MIEILGGALVMLGGGMLSAGSITLARTVHRSRTTDELVRALPFTPLPSRDAELEALVTLICATD